MQEAPARSPALAAVFSGPHGLRAGWRVLLYCLLLMVIASAASAAVALLDLPWMAPRSMLSGIVPSLIGGLGAGWILLAAVDRRRMGALGFAPEPAAARDVAVGTGVGGALLGAAVVLLAVAGTARWVADAGTVPEYVAALARALAFFFVAAAMEEVIFRGYAFQALVQGIGPWPTLILTSAGFAAAHLGNDGIDAIAFANIFLAGVMLGVAYLRTRSLWFATGVHLGWNWMMSAVLDFPVSGLAYDTPLYDGRETGADWWTGGAFGPEAGLAATLVILIGTAWLLRTRKIGESARMREMRPLVDTRLGGGW